MFWNSHKVRFSQNVPGYVSAKVCFDLYLEAATTADVHLIHFNILQIPLGLFFHNENTDMLEILSELVDKYVPIQKSQSATNDSPDKDLTSRVLLRVSKVSIYLS